MTLLCCWPIGIFAIIAASQVNGAYRSGNYKRAQQLAERSQRLTTWAVVGGLIAGVLVVVVEFL